MSDLEEKERWKAVRGLLKEALLAGEIPLDTKEMQPKAVFIKYGNEHELVFAGIPYSDKFTRMLRALRKKHNNGDLENEDKPKAIEWSKSAAKQYLKKCFREGTISSNYHDPRQVWTDHCKDVDAFKRMQCDDAFVRRLASVRDDYLKKTERCQKDLQAFTIAKRNHPTPATNFRGEPQWNGSIAQQLLKECIKAGEHTGVAPQDLWMRRIEFQVYSKDTFRDHIYQEQRLLKFNRYVGLLKQKKIDELQY